jgi:hypothetical protein
MCKTVARGAHKINSRWKASLKQYFVTMHLSPCFTYILFWGREKTKKDLAGKVKKIHELMIAGTSGSWKEAYRYEEEGSGGSIRVECRSAAGGSGSIKIPKGNRWPFDKLRASDWRSCEGNDKIPKIQNPLPTASPIIWMGAYNNYSAKRNNKNCADIILDRGLGKFRCNRNGGVSKDQSAFKGEFEFEESTT